MAHILIVDDSPNEIKTLRTALERNGYNVSYAETGADGVALARMEQPDLVLMDLIMPGLSGFQATRQLTHAEKTAHIPVIIVTSKDLESDRLWAEQQGALGYLVKPVAESLLLSEIEQTLKRHRSCLQ